MRAQKRTYHKDGCLLRVMLRGKGSKSSEEGSPQDTRGVWVECERTGENREGRGPEEQDGDRQEVL